MNILSIDSSGPMLSIELKINSESYSYSDQQKSRASQIILSSIDKIMSDNNVEITDLNMIVFNKGPASFTGTRIAASVCQAIGYTLNIPVIGVNALSLMAYSYFSKESFSRISCIKKAYGDKYYIGEFDIDKSGYSPLKELSLSSASALAFNPSIHYVSNCWDEIKSSVDEDILDGIKTIDQEHDTNAKLLLEYVCSLGENGSEFDLKMTFPDYANHTIDV